MSFLGQLLGGAQPQAGTLTPEQAFALNVSGGEAESGVTLNATTAMKISTVWACVSLIADTVAQLPKIVYQIAADGSKTRARNHPLWDLMQRQPNAWLTSFEFFELATGHGLLRGNSYSEIVPGPRGFADSLEPLDPDKVRVEQLANKRLRYRVTGRDTPILDDQMLHLRGMTYNGILGMDPITYARESWALARAAEAFGARFFGNSSIPGGVLQSDKEIKPEAARRLKAQWEAAHAGGNQHRVAVLEDGVKWQAIGIDPRNAQFLELREFQAEDVCRWFGVPPHMVGLTSKATTWGSGIEQMSMGYVTYTLMPWLIRWQQAITRDLILAPDVYEVEFLTDALLRGDTLSRYNAYTIGLQNGFLTRNEVRAKENSNPLPGGDAISTGAPAPATVPAGGSADRQQNAHYAALLREAAGRVVRKELAAMTKAAGRGEDIGQAAAIFYSNHAGFVATTLAISEERAAEYAAGQIKELSERGPEAMADWDPRKVNELMEVCYEHRE